MTEKPTVSPLVWFSLIVSALGVLLVSFVLIDGEGFLGPFMLGSIAVGAVSLVLAIVGVVRSAKRWPGVLATLLAALLTFAFPLFLVVAVIVSTIRR